MSIKKLMIHDTMNWIAANARSIGCALPDQLELLLYVGLAVYFVFQVLQQQA